MGERVVTVKMPASLVRALRARTQQEHYLDISEQIRSIVRAAALRLAQPESDAVARLREDLTEQVAHTATLTREQVLEELVRMLKGGAR